MTTDPLISTALLGTARMSALPPAPDPSLEKTWQAIAPEKPAAAILQALALTRALHLAGAGTVELSEEPAVSPPEKSAPLPAAGVDLALRLLSGEFPEILREWMRLATAARRILPPRALPQLLAMATKNKELRPAAMILVGERGLWIARRHGDFQWLLETSEAEEGAWENGSPAERLAWLRQTRANDPSSAAEIITFHWPAEDAPMRESILRLVCESPHPCDETWLESLALKDRRQEIRELATRSLVEIPGTPFHARATARLRGCVKVERRLLKRAIAIEPPTTFDPAWAADGLKEKPPGGIGEKAWWLRQIVSRIPLDEWPALLGISQDDLFSLSREEDWEKVLIAGWIESAERFPSRALAEIFIPFIAPMNPWQNTAISKSQVIRTVLEKLPPTTQFAILDKLAVTIQRPVALEFLAHLANHPPAGQGEAILHALEKELTANDSVLNRPQARALAICIPPSHIQPTLERLAKLPNLSAAAEEFATLLEFRRIMISQFQLP